MISKTQKSRMVYIVFITKFLFVMFLVGVSNISSPVRSLAQSQDMGVINSFANHILKVSLKGKSLALDSAASEKKDEIVAFYRYNDFKPIWTESEENVARTKAVISVLEKSWTHGLNPKHYNVQKLKRLQSQSSLREKAEFEFLMSDAVTSYGQDLTGMRIDPDSVAQKATYWRQKMPRKEILSNISSTESPVEFLEGLAPQATLYKNASKRDGL